MVRPEQVDSPADQLAPDQQLLELLREGQSDAAGQLFTRYAGRLRNLANFHITPDLTRRYDPDDLVQSVFRTFFRRAGGGSYSLPEGQDLWHLFLVIALNKIRNAAAFHHAAKRDTRQTAGADAIDASAADAGGDDQAAYLALRMTIEQVLNELPAEHRQMIQYRIKGYEVAEIARQTGRAKRSVERILQGFRQSLAATIAEEK